MNKPLKHDIQINLFDDQNVLWSSDDVIAIDATPIKSNFKLTRIDGNDAKYNTDHMNSFKRLLLDLEGIYPGIDKWLNRKVIPGLKLKERSAFIGYLNDKPIVTSVVKKGKRSKFCHLKIYDDFQDNHLGELFFSLMALEIRNSAEEIHFTLPESLWEKKSDFFKSFGFNEISKSITQYRLWDNELKCSAPFSVVWNSVLKKLPKLINYFSIGNYSLDNPLLMSFQPKYANRILEGKKKVELRKKFSLHWVMHRISLYSSSPEQAIVGEALIKDIQVAAPETIWAKYNEQIGCTKDEFDHYVGNSDEIYALMLDEIKPFRIKILSSQLSHLLQERLIPPQSYSILKENTAWSNAVSIATLLHSHYSISQKVFI